MKAAVLYKPNTPFEIEEVTLHDPGPGEVLVRIAASGVCHSDWHVVTGATKHELPVVLGHEGAGVVEEVSADVTSVKPGDHVILNWTPDCGECFYCLRGKPNLCGTFVGPMWAGTMMDGTTRMEIDGNPVYHFSALSTFAERVVVPQETCVPVRNDVPLKVASLVGCAVMTGIGAAMNTVQVQPGDSVAIFGCGGVGLSMIQGAQLCGAETIIAVDRAPAKMEIARSFGATNALLADNEPIKSIHELTSGRGVDYVFEAIGHPQVQELAFEAVRPGGTLVIAGISPMGTTTNFSSAIIARQEKRIVGSYYGTGHPRLDFAKILDLYMAGKLKLDELISCEYTLEEINEAYASMLTGEVARGVIVFE